MWLLLSPHRQLRNPGSCFRTPCILARCNESDASVICHYSDFPCCSVLQLPRYRFHPSRTQYRLPSSPSRSWNFSQRPSLPAPITNMVCSLSHPITPFGGWPRDEPRGGTYGEPGVASSPISKCALAKEYTSENIRGSNGSLPKMPHFWFDPSSVAEAGDWLRRTRWCGCVISKT